MTEYRKVFIDTAPLIYLLERSTIYYDKMERLLSEMYEEQTVVLTSAITVEEYCVFPYRENRLDLIQKFERFLESFGIVVYSIDDETAKRAAYIRSQYPAFKSMDAIQLAVADLQGCDGFLTNDKQLKQYAGVNCIIVDEIC